MPASPEPQGSLYAHQRKRPEGFGDVWAPRCHWIRLSIRTLRRKPKNINVIELGRTVAERRDLYRGLLLLNAAANGEAGEDSGGRRRHAVSFSWPAHARPGPWRSYQPESRSNHCSYGVAPRSAAAVVLSALAPSPREGRARSAVGRKRQRRQLERGEPARSVGRRRREEGRVSRAAMGVRIVLVQLAEPQRHPEARRRCGRSSAGGVSTHQFRTDAEAPVRRPQVGVCIPALSHDGRDLAAALGQIIEIGDGEDLPKRSTGHSPGAACSSSRHRRRVECLVEDAADSAALRRALNCLTGPCDTRAWWRRHP